MVLVTCHVGVSGHLCRVCHLGMSYSGHLVVLGLLLGWCLVDPSPLLGLLVWSLIALAVAQNVSNFIGVVRLNMVEQLRLRRQLVTTQETCE